MYDPNYVEWDTTQGWRCPVCGRVYSPQTPMCFYCSNKETTIQTTGTSVNDSGWWESYLKENSTFPDHSLLETHLYNENMTLRNWLDAQTNIWED